MTSPLESVLTDLVEGLERADIEYVLVGGMAVLAWGDPRTTRDIDVILNLDATDIDPLGKALEPFGFSFDAEGAAQALREGSHFTIFHEDSFYHVDALPANEPSHEETLKARQRMELEGRHGWIASPEDTVANKLLFGSEQDIKDAAGILARRGDAMDERRLEALCTRLGVIDDLEALRTKLANQDT